MVGRLRGLKVTHPPRRSSIEGTLSMLKGLRGERMNRDMHGWWDEKVRRDNIYIVKARRLAGRLKEKMQNVRVERARGLNPLEKQAEGARKTRVADGSSSAKRTLDYENSRGKASLSSASLRVLESSKKNDGVLEMVTTTAYIWHSICIASPKIIVIPSRSR